MPFLPKDQASHASSRGTRGAAILALAAGLVAGTPASAQNALPDYRDDRSTPEAVVDSLYNAVARKEYLRAYSYLQEGNEQPGFEAFAKGYATTEAVRVKTGTARGEGAAGATYYALPVAVESTTTGGRTAVYTGCYELRLTQPAIQVEPPFRSMGIVKGELSPSDQPFESAMGVCPAAGLE